MRGICWVEPAGAAAARCGRGCRTRRAAAGRPRRPGVSRTDPPGTGGMYWVASASDPPGAAAARGPGTWWTRRRLGRHAPDHGRQELRRRLVDVRGAGACPRPAGGTGWPGRRPAGGARDGRDVLRRVLDRRQRRTGRRAVRAGWPPSGAAGRHRTARTAGRLLVWPAARTAGPRAGGARTRRRTCSGRQLGAVAGCWARPPDMPGRCPTSVPTAPAARAVAAPGAGTGPGHPTAGAAGLRSRAPPVLRLGRPRLVPGLRLVLAPVHVRPPGLAPRLTAGRRPGAARGRSRPAAGRPRHPGQQRSPPSAGSTTPSCAGRAARAALVTLSALRHRDSYCGETYGIVGSRYRVSGIPFDPAQDRTSPPPASQLPAVSPVTPAARSSSPRAELPDRPARPRTAPAAAGGRPDTRRPGWSAAVPSSSTARRPVWQACSTSRCCTCAVASSTRPMRPAPGPGLRVRRQGLLRAPGGRLGLAQVAVAVRQLVGQVGPRRSARSTPGRRPDSGSACSSASSARPATAWQVAARRPSARAPGPPPRGTSPPRAG